MTNLDYWQTSKSRFAARYFFADSFQFVSLPSQTGLLPRASHTH